MKIILKIVVPLCAVILSLLFVESATRIIFNRNGMHYGIEMWKYAKLLKKQSDVASMSHEHYPNREAVLMGVPVKINSHGLRDYEYSIAKPEKTYRIMILGDSMTFGWGAKFEATYPKILEKMLNENLIIMSQDTSKIHRFEVMNAGVGNYNTVQEVAYLKQRGIKFNPDMVILGFYLNDAEQVPKRSKGFLKEHSYLYVLFSTVWDAFQRSVGDKKGYRDYYLSLYSDSQKGWLECKTALQSLVKFCRDKQIELKIVIIPELHSPNENYPFQMIHQLICEIGNKEKVQTIDILPDFIGIDSSSLWVSPGDPHPNAKAHAIIAKSIYNRIWNFLSPKPSQ